MTGTAFEEMDGDQQKLAQYVNSVADHYRAFVKDNNGLLSVLYDVDLLPEQLLHVLEHNPDAAAPNAARFALICDLWKMAYPKRSTP